MMPEQTGIQVKTRTFRLLLRVCSKTRIELDNGAEMLRPWERPSSQRRRDHIRSAATPDGRGATWVTPLLR